MKTIIVATDYSKCSEIALKYAAFIAKTTHSSILLLNYYRFNIHALNARLSPQAMEKLIDNNQQFLESYAQQASYEHDIEIIAKTTTSLSEESLSLLANEYQAGLLIMGVKQGYNAYLTSESISTNIIINSKIPVMVVPEKIEFKIPSKVLYACDYHSIPDSQKLNSLKEIINSFKSELQVFHVWQNEEEELLEIAERGSIVNEFEQSLSNITHNYKDLKSTSILEGLEKGVKEYDADIIVMSPHKYTFWNSLFHKSKTLAMAFKSSIPLMSLPS